MATLDHLRRTLRQAAEALAAGFEILVRDAGWLVYQDFIIPQLSQLLNARFKSRTNVSALEIGPGPKSILAHLSKGLRRKTKTYTAFEPNGLFATRLEEQLRSTSEVKSPLPYLEHPPKIYRHPFDPQNNVKSCTDQDCSNDNAQYDFILFCHSILVEQPQGGIVVVFHRDGVLNLDGLVCHRTASFPTGVVRVADDNEVLDSFAHFIAGYTLKDTDEDDATRAVWRRVRRTLGRHEEGYLSFSSPNVMMALTHHATTFPELTTRVQQCVEWALRTESSLTVIGGSHSGHCLSPNIVAVDMSAFDQVCVVGLEEGRDRRAGSGDDFGLLVVAEAGSTVGDIVRKTTAAGVTVPLGARPSVGAGLWLQGEIGHLSRLHRLACDAIVGAIIVRVDSSQILCIGYVPSQHIPAGAVRHKDETDLLWAMKGAGTNFGIVISVTFKAFAAAAYLTRDRIVPLSDKREAQFRLHEFDTFIAKDLGPECSADAYLYCEDNQLHLGVTVFESFAASSNAATSTKLPEGVLRRLETKSKVMDGVELFDSEMYMSGMHSGHGGGKTSSFKRCIFLKQIGEAKVANRLIVAVESRSSQLCYLHLLHGGGAVRNVQDDVTAFGCRDWDFACVITSVWQRDQDDTEVARSIEQWVYKVAGELLSLGRGAYGADLGPDPRDAALAVKAFGPNLPRLARLKNSLDPKYELLRNVLAYACPLPCAPMPKLIILVTGESGAGKDYCADIWTSIFSRYNGEHLLSRVVSISDATKQEYAAAHGTDLHRLLKDRAYKEQHRPALTAFFQEQVRQRPLLLEEHFLNLVHDAAGVDVLLITGMRDEAPVSTLSHLVPESRLLEVYVEAAEETRNLRRWSHGGDRNGNNEKCDMSSSKDSMIMNYRPTFIFNNDTMGKDAAEGFAERFLTPYLHEGLERLAHMVRVAPNFPCPGIRFRRILGIAQQPGGLTLCTSLLQKSFNGDWNKVGAIACCEAGGFVYASVLARQIEVLLLLIRDAGKLPPPTISVPKTSSHISSIVSDNSEKKRIEMERDAIPWGASVVVVDDVISTGETLCAVLQLLCESGVGIDDISIMVVAEFPAHHGRRQLHRRGFGRVSVQSLLVFDGA
ncbi:hypothetical protein EK21DRAFT_104210 [Setomelanomma holmii]|uniref:FAD-binding PCMH-type domain-containing protein n=1 Tax=Setomelanomma holmii TaxID=210430 RepID=A0A9P4H0W3_9PLEO|nr:hypothetical protein EK21DRAFT_104210 [Setomelanomma holmii]